MGGPQTESRPRRASKLSSRRRRRGVSRRRRALCRRRSSSTPCVRMPPPGLGLSVLGMQLRPGEEKGAPSRAARRAGCIGGWLGGRRLLLGPCVVGRDEGATIFINVMGRIAHTSTLIHHLHRHARINTHDYNTQAHAHQTPAEWRPGAAGARRRRPRTMAGTGSGRGPGRGSPPTPR